MPKTAPQGSFSSLQLILEYIMERGVTALRPGEANTDDPLKRAFAALESQLQLAPPIRTCPTLMVETSLARGRVAAVPWAGIMDRRVTRSIQEGVYLTYLFRQDMSGVYLVAMLGITKLSPEEKERPDIAGQRAAEMRHWFSGLQAANFVVGERPDLHANKGERYAAYEAGTIAHKFYPRGEVPGDAQLYQDLRDLLAAYDRYIRTEKPRAGAPVVRIAYTGSDATWGKWLAEGYAGLPQGFMVKAVTSYSAPSQIADILLKEEPDFEGRPELARRRAAELWLLKDLQPGATVVATRGLSEVLAVGKVITGYSRALGKADCTHTIGVEWNPSLAKRIRPRLEWAGSMIDEMAFLDQEELLAPGTGVTPRRDLAAVYSNFRSALKGSNLSFSDDTVRSFVASLATKRFAILTGVSGSGKTQLALRFGEWLGEGRGKIVAVRPDWTGAEALFGFEDALQPPGEGGRPWHVPEALQFMIQAARDPNGAYLLILDEMNLAHVERYFADVLSGMESGQPVLPNLFRHTQDGTWRRRPGEPDYIAVPENLFVVGTVNVDETTYMFSPKVLDRANTFEFVVRERDLTTTASRPVRCEPGPADLVTGFLSIACDDSWHSREAASGTKAFAEYLRQVHTIVQAGGFGFAHRVFYEAIRFFTMLSATGPSEVLAALDLQIKQKVLPRLHGNRRKLEPMLAALGQFCFDLKVDVGSVEAGQASFDFDRHQVDEAKLMYSYEKLKRMNRNLRANQFAGFAE